MNQFLLEILKRFGAKNPKFFDYIQYAAIALGGVSAIISYLHTNHIALPAWVDSIGNATVQISSVVAVVIAQLPNEDKTVTNEKAAG